VGRIAITIGLALSLLLVSTTSARAQRVETVCVETSSTSIALTNGGDTKGPDDPEPTKCDQRHWQTLMIFTGFVNTGLAFTATEALISGKRLGRRFSWAMFIASAPQAVFGAKFLANDLTDGDIDMRDMLLLGSTVISAGVAAYSGWNLVSHKRERQRATPRGPSIRVGAAPSRHGLMLGASGLF